MIIETSYFEGSANEVKDFINKQKKISIITIGYSGMGTQIVWFKKVNM